MPAFQDFWPRWRQALDTAGHRGALCFGRPRGRRVTYAHPRRWLPGFRPAPADEAVGAVAPALPARLRARHVAAVRPVDRRSAAVGGRPLRRARVRPHRGVVRRVSGLAWRPTTRRSPTGRCRRSCCCRTSTPSSSAVVPRERLFPGPAATRALAPSGQAGNFPVLLVDGVAAGVWHQRRSGRRVAVTVEPLRRLSRAHLTALEAEVARVGRDPRGRPDAHRGSGDRRRSRLSFRSQIVRNRHLRWRPWLDNDTPWEPPLAGTETEQLFGALDRLRTTFRWKAGELDAAGLQARIGSVVAHPRRPAQAPRGQRGLPHHREAQRRAHGRALGGQRLGRRRRLGVHLRGRRLARGALRALGRGGRPVPRPAGRGRRRRRSRPARPRRRRRTASTPTCAGSSAT